MLLRQAMADQNTPARESMTRRRCRKSIRFSGIPRQPQWAISAYPHSGSHGKRHGNLPLPQPAFSISFRSEACKLISVR